LEVKNLEYKTVEEFLVDLRKEFWGEDNKTIKVAELKRLKQESKTMKEFVQEFRRVVRESEYKGQLLIKKFKRGMNGSILWRLIKLEYQLGTIEQWYKRATNLDRNWRESRRNEERLKGRRYIENQVPR